MDYKSSGVDQEKMKRSINALKLVIEKTHQSAGLGSVIGESGGYSGIFRSKSEYQNYDLVATTDGVGTKIELCSRFSYFEPLGYDLIAMCVNDLYCSGAHPAFFLDYISCGKLSNEWYLPIINNISKACEMTGMALLGGETAEHPGLMKKGEFDLAGFCVGFVHKNCHLPRLQEICEGDILIGLASSGIHSNGFSLVRMVLKEILQNNSTEYNKLVNDRKWIEKQLLAPTTIYHKLPQLTQEISIKGIAHITGGGIYENLPRILPKNFSAIIDNKNSFFLPIYDWLKNFISEKELFKTFNMGYGMILVMDKIEAKKILSNHAEATQIGYIQHKVKPEDASVIFV